jgi:predicted acyltransferase (DUF342 family)
MPNLQTYKIIIGSDNDYIYEDPILGSNGTAVVNKINGLIDAIELSSNGVEPADKGYLVTKTNAQAISQLPPGVDKYCLISATASPRGLAYEERVDLYSNQVMLGNKSFSGSTTVNTLQASGAVGIVGLLTTNDINSGNVIIDGTLRVNQGTDLRSTLSVTSGTILLGTLRVDNQATFQAPILANATLAVAQATTLASVLTVGGATNLSSTLSVQGTTSLIGVVNTTSSLLVGTSLTVTGATNIGGNSLINGSLTVNGASLFGNNLTVTGVLTTNDLTIQDDLTVGDDVSIAGDINITGSITSPSSLSIGGISNLNGQVNAGSNVSVGNDLTVIRDLSVGRNTSLTGTLNVVGPTTVSILGSAGDITAGGALRGQTAIIVGDTSIGGATTLAGALSVGTTASVTGVLTSGSSVITTNLSVGTNVLILGNQDVRGASITRGEATFENDLIVEGSQSIEGDLVVLGDINGRDLILSGNGLVVGNLSSASFITGSIVANSNLDVNGSAILTSLSVSGNSVFGGNVNANGLISASNLSGVNTGDEEVASITISGTVRSDVNSVNPIVYLKSSIDSTFARLDSIAQFNGIASLDGNGKVPTNQLPAFNITDVYVVGSEPSMLALSADSIGDVAVRTDINVSFILKGLPATDIANWQELLTPSGSGTVTSIYGRAGIVTSMLGDYTASQITFTPVGTLLSTNAQAALQEVSLHSSLTNNPHSVTAVQVGAIPLTQKAVANGVASLGSDAKVPLIQLPDLVLPFSIDFQASNLVSNSLTVVHNLGKLRLSSVTLWNNSNRVVIPDEIEVIDDNTLIVSLISYNTPTPIPGIWTLALVR